MSYRDAVKSLTPPLLLESMHRLLGRRLRFAGTPGNWQEACRLCGGYSSEDILRRVAEATRAVLEGRAAYERDGVLFDGSEQPFHILAALLRAAVMNGPQPLDVIDFGGSLGSTFRQLRPLLPLRTVRWQIVEQPSFVDVGRRQFTTTELSFCKSLDEVRSPDPPAVLLALSVLQYLEKPYEVLRSLAAISASTLVIDRTPVSAQSSDRLCIQHTPSSIYRASYPMWILSRQRLAEELDPDWRVLADFESAERKCRTDDGLHFEFRGLILERRS